MTPWISLSLPPGNKIHAHALLTRAVAAREDDSVALCGLAKLSSEMSREGEALDLYCKVLV
jgi:hypothetical protein